MVRPRTHVLRQRYVLGQGTPYLRCLVHHPILSVRTAPCYLHYGEPCLRNLDPAGTTNISMQIFCTIVLMRPSDPPTIKKLSQADVDRIPLVLYIPPPPEDHLAKAPINTPQPVTRPSVPASAPSQPASKSKRHRFVFLRPSWLNRRSATARTPVEDSERGAGEDNVRPDGGGDGDEWDQTWERGAHPFVRLPENLATCGICLLEFEAPRRLNSCRSRLAEDAEEDGEEDDDDGEELEMGEMPTKAGTENEPGEKVAVELPQPVDKQAVQSAESGSGDAPEPLRLLSCGHAYHVSLSRAGTEVLASLYTSCRCRRTAWIHGSFKSLAVVRTAQRQLLLHHGALADGEDEATALHGAGV